MTFRASTDPDEVRSVIEGALAHDPVGNAVFDSVLGSLAEGCWAAWDGDTLAARGRIANPVALTSGWSDLTPLVVALRELPGLAGLNGPVETVGALDAALARPLRLRMAEQQFRLDRLEPPVGVTGSARLARPGDLDLLSDWYTAFRREAFGMPPSPRARAVLEQGIAEGRPWVWEAAATVSSLAVCHPSRTGVTAIGPVYTPPQHRGHGYGSAVTAAATSAILRSGAVPTLVTDLANPTSNKIYQAMGYYPIGERAAVYFA